MRFWASLLYVGDCGGSSAEEPPQALQTSTAPPSMREPDISGGDGQSALGDTVRPGLQVLELLDRSAGPFDDNSHGLARGQSEGQGRLGLGQVTGAGLHHARLRSAGPEYTRHGPHRVPV